MATNLLDQLVLILLALFLVSFGSNATPVVGASYTLIAAATVTQYHFTLLGLGVVVIVTALGAALAKAVIYTGGLGFSKRLVKNRNVQLLGKWLGNRSFYAALFIAAAIPALPLDDYIFIGAGANKGTLSSMLGVTITAKLIKSAIEIPIELSALVSISGIISDIGLNSLSLSIVLTGFFIVLGIAIYSIDWQKMTVRFQREQ